MDDADLIRELRALADRIEQRAPASSQPLAADPLGGLERASIAEEVASLVRHDLRNHLASIRNAAFYLRRRTKGTEIWRSDPRMSQFFLLIDDTVLEATGLLEDRLILKHLFSRNVARVPGASCVDEGAARARVPAAVKLEIEAGAGEVVADRAEVALAIRCLIDNALEAAASCVKVSARAGAGRYEVAVSDDGAGVPEALAEQIFDAFYTTKEGARGWASASLGASLAGTAASSPCSEAAPRIEALAWCLAAAGGRVRSSQPGGPPAAPRRRRSEQPAHALGPARRGGVRGRRRRLVRHGQGEDRRRGRRLRRRLARSEPR